MIILVDFLKTSASINVLIVFPQRRGGGDTLGIRQPKQSLPPGICQTTVAQGRVPKMSRLQNIEEIMPKFEGTSRGF